MVLQALCHSNIMFFMRLISLPIDFIYKRLLIIRYCYHLYDDSAMHTGPVMTFINICRKYEVLDIVTDAIENCQYIPKCEWKRLVTSRIRERENKSWSVFNRMYKSIQILRCILPTIKQLPWWQYVQANPCEMTKCRSVIRLLFDCHSLKSCLFRYKCADVANPYCEYCDYRAVEDPHHVLFVCTENLEMRNRLWQEIRCTLPDAMGNEVDEMSIPNKLLFLLGGLGSYIPEWIDIYKSCVQYVHVIYNARVRLNRLQYNC